MILLVFVDMTDSQDELTALARLSVTHDLTMLLAWTLEEAARYLETFKGR